MRKVELLPDRDCEAGYGPAHVMAHLTVLSVPPPGMNFIPIPKSGDLSKGGNYRGTSLSSIVGKIFNKMILYTE